MFLVNTMDVHSDGLRKPCSPAIYFLFLIYLGLYSDDYERGLYSAKQEMKSGKTGKQ